MKKTIAMLSALAISASLVMPFSAFAEDTAVQVTKLTSAELTDFDSTVNALGLKENATFPEAITGEAANDEVAYLIYGYSGTTFLVAVYRSGNAQTTVEEGISTVRTHINSGNNYYYYSATSAAAAEDEPAATAVKYVAVNVQNSIYVNSAQEAKAAFDALGAVTFSSMAEFPDKIEGDNLPKDWTYPVYGYYDDDKLTIQYYRNGVKQDSTWDYEYKDSASIGGRNAYVLVLVNQITNDDVTAGNNKSNTNVKYSIDPAYTITIPAAVELDADEQQDATFKVEGAESGESPLLHKDDKIVVKLTGAANGFSGDGEKDLTVKTAGGKGSATYNVLNENSEKVGQGGTIAEFVYEPGKETAYWTKKATFTQPSGATYAGVYTDTLTFNISVKNTNSNSPVGP